MLWEPRSRARCAGVAYRTNEPGLVLKCIQAHSDSIEIYRPNRLGHEPTLSNDDTATNGRRVGAPAALRRALYAAGTVVDSSFDRHHHKPAAVEAHSP
jgi:hypothetical protein